MKLKPCGTTAAYYRHIRSGETACDDCRTAMTRQRSRYPRKKYPRERAWTVRDEVRDFLALEGWATAYEIADRFDRNVDSVERALRSLRGDGEVESRVVELAHAAGRLGMESRIEWRTRA